MSMHELVATKHIHWAHAATDSSKLRSVLLHPAHYKGLTLYEQRSRGSYALTHEELQDGAVRCSVFGNLDHGQPDYTHAAQQIVQQQPQECRFSALPGAAVEHTRQVFEASAYQQHYINPCFQYVLAGQLLGQLQQQCTQMAQEFAGAYELSTLQQQDAALVDGLWTFRSPGSQAMIEQLIAERHNACVRSISTGEPVAWVLEPEPGCAGMLHTVEGHRKKGLAKWAFASLLSKLQLQHQQQEEQLQQQQQQQPAAMMRQADSSGCGAVGRVGGAGSGCWPGGHVYCYVVQGNTASMQLMESLGLTNTGTYVWVGFKQQD